MFYRLYGTTNGLDRGLQKEISTPLTSVN